MLIRASPVLVVMVVTVGAFMGASTKKAASATSISHVWPSAPAEARIAYVQSISMPADYGVKTSTFGKISSWFTGKDKNNEVFNKPFGLAVDDLGNLCITDTGENNVGYFDRQKKRFSNWSAIGKTKFMSPVAVAKKGGTFYVADSGLGRVLAFNEKGKVLFSLTDQIIRPVALAIGGESIYVADAERHSIVAFNLAGKFLFKFGRRGSSPGEFNFPTHLAVDLVGNVLVTDSMNNRVEVFDNTGKYLRAIGSAGDSTGHFSRPKGVAVDGAGRIYVVDALFGNFQIFDSTGALLLDVGQNGNGPGEFWLPNAIAISRDNLIYVTDSYNHRVQVFKYVGEP